MTGTERSVEATVLDLEEQLWAANRAGDGEFYRERLADDVVGVFTRGHYDKAMAVREVSENRIPFTSTRMSDPRVIVLAPDSALVTYRCDIEALHEGQTLQFPIYATTVWRRANDEWRAVLHQQTPIQEG
jgi:ketosteroid isomerase-like protein